MTTMPAKTSPNPARTRRSIDQWVNHSMSRPVLGIGAGLLSGAGSDRTDADVTGGSCVTDSMAQTYTDVGYKPMSWKLYPPPEHPARNILTECSLKRSGIVPAGT